MQAQTAIQKKLGERLTEARLKNPAFSVRAFSKRLGVSPTTLSRVLNGRRSVSLKLAGQLTQRLGLSPVEANELLALFPQKRPYRRLNAADSLESQDDRQLAMDQYHLVSDWYHFGLRALLRTADAQSSPRHCRPAWLARRLDIKVGQTTAAIERLLRLGMIERLADGRLRATDEKFHSPDGIPSVSIRHNHAQHLELARASLERDAVALRDFTNLTMAINPARLPEAREIIRRFRKEIERTLENEGGEPRCEVYSLAIQLFPLTRRR